MSSRSTRTRQNRRDRRKARASGFAREGTVKPKIKAHHISESRMSGGLRKSKVTRQAPKKATRLVYADRFAGTNLRAALREAGVR